MPKPATTRKAKPITIRPDAALLRRLTAIGDAQKFRPTLTQLVEDALREYVERYERSPKR